MLRLKKIASALLAVLLVTIAGCYFGRAWLGERVIRAAMGDFDPAKAPPAPDYALASSWAALPDKVDASDRVPKELTEPENPARDQVDVFYIHPTGYNGRENWNGEVSKGNDYDIPTSLMLAGQASAFNGCGRVYAPEYRQASLMAYIQALLVAPHRKDGLLALDLAYSDVARAFDYFIEHYNKDRPFIIAAHSQGSGHALRLLAEKIDGTPLYARMIAAYVIGADVPVDYFERVYKDINPCASPTQSGCLIAWQTFRENAWVPSWGIIRYPEGWESVNGRKTFSVNPLSWTSDETRVPASANTGALKARFVPKTEHPDGCVFVGLSPQHTWAQCHAGKLWVADQTDPTFYDRAGFYHLFDYGLFWKNIRDNARTRADAYLHTHAQLAGQ